MSKTNKKGAGREGYAAAYKAEGRMQKNRKRKLERQAKLQPNNDNIRKALLDIRYRRATPKAPFWSASMIATAKLFKEFGGSVDINIFSADEKKRAEALRTPSKYAQLPVSTKKPKFPTNSPGMFSILARLQNGRKGSLWTS